VLGAAILITRPGAPEEHSYAILTFEDKPTALSRNVGRRSHGDATPHTRIAETSLIELLNKGIQPKPIRLFISETQHLKENSGNTANNSQLFVELMTRFRVLLIKYQQNLLQQGVAQFAVRFINLSFLFGIRRNCLKSGRSRS